MGRAFARGAKNVAKEWSNNAPQRDVRQRDVRQQDTLRHIRECELPTRRMDVFPA
jgi:hypothetical protein